MNMFDNATLGKEIQDVFDAIESGLQRHDETNVRGAIEAGEKLLLHLSWKPAIAQLNSKLGNVQTGLFLQFEYDS